MAKELPYFKFEPSEWQNGNIQMCSDKARIVFIDICCSYWQRLGVLPYAFALQRHCGGIENVMQELENAQVLKVENDFLTITFLDEQIIELSKKSDKARQSAEARWNKKKNANASKTQSERNAKRREENRIEEKKKEKEVRSTGVSTKPPEQPKVKRSIFIPPELIEVQNYCSERRNNVNPQQWHDHYTSNGWMVGKNKMKDWKAAVRTWEKNNYNKSNNGTTTAKGNQDWDAAASGWVNGSK